STMKSETAVSIIFGTLSVFLAALAVLQAVKYTQKVEALLRANSVQRNAYFVVWVFTITNPGVWAGGLVGGGTDELP
ncbi:MAG: hypothetical protein Q9202_007062, partial [Teloschistes flavicans]